MRKYVATFLMMVLVLGLLPLLTPTSAEAQTYVRRYVDSRGRVRYRRVAKPSYYRRHRNRVNMAVGTGAGAIIGGLIGGRRGAVIGGATGLGGSALYTYKIKPKRRKYRKIRRY
jgi:hypothetical protein